MHKNLMMTAAFVALAFPAVAFAQAPPVGPGHCVANCPSPYRGGGGGGGGGGSGAGIGNAVGLGMGIMQMMPVDPDNRFGNAPTGPPSKRKLQYVTHDTPHFNPGALSVDKNRKHKRGLQPIDANSRK
jgi:hypothetical protein